MNNKFETYFFKVIYGLCGITLLLYVFSLFQRPIHVDTAILGEPVYWLGKDGFLRSELQRGWYHAEEHFFFTHKLFLYIGAFWTDLFGWSAIGLDSLSLMYLGFLIGAWWKMAKDNGLPQKYFVLFLFLLMSNHHIYELSFVFRPEIGLAACASWTYYFLDRFLKNEQFRFFLGASVLGAIGVGHHLNGVIFVIAGFSLLVWHKKYIAAVGFGLMGALGLGFYFIDIRSLPDFDLMVSQLFNMQDIQSEHKTWLHYILNVPKEQARFLHSPAEIGFTLITAATLILGFRKIRAQQKNLIVYTAAAIFTLALISHDKDTKYLALNIPALTFLMVISIKAFFTEESFADKNWIFNKMLPICIVLFLLGQWRNNFSLTFNHRAGPERFAALAWDLPEDLNVLGPTEAVFWALPHHQRFQSQFVYKVLESHHLFELDQSHLEKALAENEIDAVMIDPEFLKIFKMSKPEITNFQLVAQDDVHHLYLLRHNK